MSAFSQSVQLYRGEDVSLALTGEGADDPTGYALAFTLSEYPGQSPAVVTVTSGIVVGGSGPFVITVPLSAAQTAALRNRVYVADLWRTDTGQAQCLARLSANVDDPVRVV